ncbi:MAG: 2-deoxy-5-keto-D-gluconate 6-phosphate aldolase domain-containing protein [Solirubrobacterales bacterium]
MALGYAGPLYILAFDHRGSYSKGVFGFEGTPTGDDLVRAADGKKLIWEGFSKAVDIGKDAANGVLVDEQFGGEVARAAGESGVTLAMPTEKSGQTEFDFEYGDDFPAHIEDFDPTFTKVLVRYNPDGDQEMNERQSARLARLSDWLHENGRKFLFELLVPAEPDQLEQAGGDKHTYDVEIRPDLVVRTIAECQAAGIEADVWKIEGLDRREDCVRVSEQARAEGRDGVACVVLGRGADSDAVANWLRVGADVPGYIGFAVGRTIWMDPLKSWMAEDLSRDEATDQIAANYSFMVDAFTSARDG